MDVLVTYDVETVTEGGARRLRRVAAICSDYGQRVQKSVFECRVTQAQLEKMESELVETIDASSDSLRIYVLPGGRERCLRVYGIDQYIDYTEPLIT